MASNMLSSAMSPPRLPLPASPTPTSTGTGNSAVSTPTPASSGNDNAPESPRLPPRTLSTRTAFSTDSTTSEGVCRHGGSCTYNALQSFTRNFALAFSVRAGISLIGRIIRLMRSNPKALLSISQLMSEEHVTFRVAATRLGLFFGGFSALYKALLCGLRSSQNDDSAWQAGLAGFVASVASLALDRETRRTAALLLAVRAAQCGYNASKARNWFHFFGSDWPHGDSLLFGIASAQVMYCYALRPEVLPRSYYKFILSTGPIDDIVLQTVRAMVRGTPPNLPAVTEYCLTANPKWHPEWLGSSAAGPFAALMALFTPAVKSKLAAAKLQRATSIALAKVQRGVLPLPLSKSAAATMIPCSVLHPHQRHCSVQAVQTWVQSFRRGLPLYLSYSIAPAVVLRRSKFLASPLGVLAKCIVSALRSSAFLASFVGIYMASICVHRKLFRADNKAVYFVAGLLASTSILLEDKPKRSELALYVMPRALDSLWLIMAAKGIVKPLPHGETLLFAAGISTLMMFHQHERQSMGSLIRMVLNRWIGVV